MYPEILPPLVHDIDAGFPYSYLLQWEWPEHIESLLRRLIWARLAELGPEAEENSTHIDPSDYLAAKLCFLMAVHPETNAAVLDVLASTYGAAYAERVAENPKAAPTTLARLSQHSNSKVRAAVAQNINTPLDSLNQLVADQHEDVRFALAENFSIPKELLDRLAEDDNCFVAHRAKKTLSRLFMPEIVKMPFKSSQSVEQINRKSARAY